MLAGCSEQASLHYTPAGTPRSGAAPSIAAVVTIDRRDEADPTWIGAVRGGYGNPLKVLHLSQPLKDVVADAVRDALRARGLLSPNGQAPFNLTVTVLKFESTQMVRREAEATIAIDLIDQATSKVTYHDQAAVDLVEGAGLAMGVLGSPSDLQGLAQRALVQAIDQLLDNPAFASAVRSAP
jgi:uncharacterized lipoprotein YajG